MTMNKLPASEIVLVPDVSRVNWQRWLWAFDVHNLSTNMLFTGAIWMIYLADRGYSPLALGLFETLFHLAKFLTEVPTGIFADMLGRRKSLMLYCLLTAVETLLFLVPAVPLIALSFIISGTAYAFRGGAAEALLWNIAGSAEPDNQTQRYSRMVSRMYLLAMLGEFIGTTTGGYLSTLLLVLPFLLRSLCALLGIIPLLFIPEQKIAASERTSALLHLGKGLRAVWRSPTLLGLLLIGGLCESCWQTIAFFYQLYLHNQGLSLAEVGLIVGIGSLSSFAFTALAPHVMNRLRTGWLIAVFLAWEILAFWLMSLPQTWLDLIGYLLFFQAAISILLPAFSTYINERSPEAQRATVLSLQTGMFSAAMIVLFPLFGLGVSSIPYSTVIRWTALVLLVGTLVVLCFVVLLRQVRGEH